nr:beta-glucosidase-like SFR2, chloroplastic [Tanacetum cinerariifolium]
MDPCLTRVPLRPTNKMSKILGKPNIGFTCKKGGPHGKANGLPLIVQEIISSLDLVQDPIRQPDPVTGGPDEPIMRPYVERDWRFGHYEMEGLQHPFSRFSRFLTRLIPLTRRKKVEDREEYDELMFQPV